MKSLGFILLLVGFLCLLDTATPKKYRCTIKIKCTFFKCFTVCVTIKWKRGELDRRMVPPIIPCNFSDYDTDDNDFIDRKELKKGLKNLMKGMYIKAVFNTLDTNGDKRIDRDEFEAKDLLYRSDC